MNNRRFPTLLTLGVFFCFGANFALSDAKPVVADDGGIAINAGASGTFRIDNPQLESSDGTVKHPLARSQAGNGGTTQELTYEGGASMSVTVADGVITYTWKGLPADVNAAHLVMLVPYDLSQGGSFKMGDKAAAAFPVEQPPKPHIFQGPADTVALTTQDKSTLKLDVPQWSYVEMTDNRAWNWKTFALHIHVPVSNRDTATMKVSLNSAAASGPRVDKFGQAIAADFPEKIASEEQLKADVQAEKDYFAGLQPPPRDQWGGFQGSGLSLEKTGYFHTQNVAGKWYMVDPDGNLFFVKGVCSMLPVDDYTYIAGRENIYEWLPKRTGEFATAFRPEDAGTALSFHLTNQIRKYGQPFDPETFSARMLDRLHAWGFNAFGPFTADTQAAKAKNFPYSSGFPLWNVPTIPGVTGTFDPFDPKTLDTLEKAVVPVATKNANDPRLIGYFLTNEPIFEDVPRVVPRLTGSSPAKQELVKLLRQRYADVAAFNKAWNLQLASLDELADKPLVATTDTANADVADYCDDFFDTYYSVYTKLIRDHDSHHLLLGNRLQSGTINNERLMKIAAKYLDVISFNYYTYGIDASFLQRIYGWTNKPMMLTEYFFDSPGDSGLPGGGKDLSSQTERGLAFRNYVEQSASLGFVLGTQWFTLVDQSYTGRWFQKYNGENANSGLIAVTDRPWHDMLAEMMKTNYNVESVVLGTSQPYVWNDPRASAGPGNKQLVIAHAAGNVPLDGTTTGFPGVPAETIPSSRLVLGKDAGGVEAAFKLCWDEQNLYVNVAVKDPTPQHNNHSPADLWSGDGVELFIGAADPEKSGAMLPTDRQIFLSGAADAKSGINHHDGDTGIRSATFPAADGKGYTVQAAIPFKSLGFTPTAGKALQFDLAIDDSADGQQRLRQLVWNGTDRNSSDRSGWGKGRFGQ